MKSDTAGTLRTLGMGVAWQALRYPFLLLGMVVVPRIMGVTTYGRFALFMSVFLIAESFTGLGNVQVFGRFTPAGGADVRAERTRFLHGMLFYGLVLAVLVAAAALAVLAAVRPGGFPMEWALVLTPILLLGKTQGTLFSFLYGLNQIGRFAARDFLRSVFNVVLVIGMYLAFGLAGALWALALNEALLALVAATWAAPYLFRPVRAAPLREFWPYLAFGLSFYLPAFLRGVLQRAGTLMVGSLTQSPEQTSFFDVGNQFIGFAGTFLGMVMMNLVPHLRGLHDASEGAEAGRWMRLALTYCGIAAGLGFLALVLFGRPAIAAVLGPDFSGAYANAVVAALSLGPLLLVQAGMNLSVLHKSPGAYVAAVVAGVCVMLAGCAVLVPRLGSIGASCAVVAGNAVSGLLLTLRFRRELLPASAGMFTAVGLSLLCLPLAFHALTLPVALLLLTVILPLYLAVVAALGAVRLEHLRAVLSLMQRGEDRPEKP